MSRRDAAAARFAAERLFTTHGRFERARAVLGGAKIVWRPVRDTAAVLTELSAPLSRAAAADEWLAVRDYGGSARGRGALFVFTGSRNELREVVKWRPAGAEGNSLQHESAILTALHERGGELAAATVPRSNIYEVVDGYELLSLSVLPGVPMWIAMQRSLRPLAIHSGSLVAAGEWLGAMQRATSTERGCIVHGDLWPRNLLVSDRRLRGVVDWERGELHGPEWQDLFDLALLFVLDLPRWRAVDPVAAFRAGFVQETALRSAVERYLHSWSMARAPHDLRLGEMFDRYVDASEADAGKEKRGWKSDVPWSAIRDEKRNARRSVFSG